MKRSGFTLIEMMLAIAMGSLVVYVAVAGLRVTSQAIVTANKLAIDNAVMRAGVHIAMMNTDFWIDRDDPHSTAAVDENLRVTSRYNVNRSIDSITPILNRGQAFTPFSLSAASTGFGTSVPTPTTTSVVLAGRDESSIGWDTNAWHAASARSWCYANMAESPRDLRSPQMKHTWMHQIQGRYHLLCAPGTAGIPLPNHPWQQRQAIGLWWSLGPYGMLDYLPANTPIVAYLPDPASPGPQSIPPWTTGIELVGGTWQETRSGGGRFGISNHSGFAVPNRTVSAANLANVSATRYPLTVSGIGSYHLNNLGATTGFAAMLKDGEYTDGILRSGNKPAHWPSMQVSSLRFIREGNFINLNRVVMNNSLTGQAMQISFSSFGTTLRGARQQRAKGLPGTAAGWADPFPTGATPLANLDSP